MEEDGFTLKIFKKKSTDPILNFLIKNPHIQKKPNFRHLT